MKKIILIVLSLALLGFILGCTSPPETVIVNGVFNDANIPGAGIGAQAVCPEGKYVLSGTCQTDAPGIFELTGFQKVKTNDRFEKDNAWVCNFSITNPIESGTVQYTVTAECQ